ncbi:TetR/AcrR family transcriptional regulator [Noviherbaspirillum denitrificans]|uniref:HTH tetR-type domain-containing protein n=1 Tax=Noviherbaspirillum denitrificans TaxID=1968433 RepID=A0A254TPZ0_9BURK|nr:TetR/AcrR family transcriptional regulator [Noviherbaspirillum denitrificans]OWW22733.1 hypothetical protein AYR66_06865 [Noviherbaspirillum denitrificans]
MPQDLSAASPRPRGRPKRPENEVHDKIIEAATWAFLNLGYADATVDTIAKRAGLAKKTIYRFAEGKADLLGIVIKSWTDSYLPVVEKDPASPEEFLQVLREILTVIANRALSREAVGIFRLLVADSARFPELPKVYNQNGVERAITILSAWIRRQQVRGMVPVKDAEQASGLLLSMLIAEPLRQAALGLACPMPDYEIEPRIDACLRVFQAGFGAL